jgi:hypothetical protein
MPKPVECSLCKDIVTISQDVDSVHVVIGWEEKEPAWENGGKWRLTAKLHPFSTAFSFLQTFLLWVLCLVLEIPVEE